MVNLRVLALSVLAVIHTAWATPSTEIDLLSYGMKAPVAANSCPTTVATQGFFIDRSFGVDKCFTRQVECDTSGQLTGNIKVCEDGKMFVNDGDTACVTADTTTAVETCGVTIDCGLDGIKVYIDHEAIWDQTAGHLQFGTNEDVSAADASCAFDYDSTDSRYEGTLSFGTAGTDESPMSCIASSNPTVAADTSGDGIHLKYEFKVMRYAARGSVIDSVTSQRVEETHGATVTREKCFMIDATCYYNPDGTATSSYVPSSPNALDEHDDSELNFNLVPVDCNDKEGASIVEQSGANAVYVTDDVCFRTEIEADSVWHDNVWLQTADCWATPTDNSSDTTRYELDSDNSFDWLCSDDSTHDPFKFTAFRFQSDTVTEANSASTYAQTIYIHCDVHVCEDSDTDGECAKHTDCGDANTEPAVVRRRRAAEYVNPMLPKLTKRQVSKRMFVLPAEKREMEFQTPTYNMLSDALSLGIFAVGCVFGIVALGMFVVMRRTKNDMKYRVLNDK